MAKKIEATAGQVLINSLLPDDLKDYSRTLDKKGVAELLRQVAERYPEKYKDISHRLGQLGWRSAYLTGGNSFKLQHIRKAKASREMQAKLMTQLQEVIDDDNLTDKQREDLIVRFSGEAQGKIQDAVLKESYDEDNQLAMQLKGAGRGNPTSLASIRSGDLLYTDHRSNIIPVPVLRSYSEGLRPSEYWAGTYGARKGVLDTKFATQDAGFFGKQLNQITHRLVVTGLDSDKEPDTIRGLPVDTDDADNEGALLAQNTGPYKRNTVLTPKILRHLKEIGKDHILVRSPMVFGSPDGGVYARDVGVRERGGLSAIGELPGMTAAQALSEPLSQGMLCIARGTLVRMADFSVKPIEQIQVGDWVLGSDLDGNLKPVRVLNIYDNGIKDCVRSTFTVGATREYVELVSTSDHKILADIRTWARDTEKCERMVAPLSTKCVKLNGIMPTATHEFDGVDDPYALLLGLLLGDGCYTESVNGVHLSCFDPTLIVDIEPPLTALGLKATKLKGHTGYYRISQIEQVESERNEAGQFVEGVRNPALAKLHELGMHGLYAHEKKIPAEVYSYSKQSLRELISGLFVTDGSVYVAKQRIRNGTAEPYVGFGSTSLEMITALKELLRVRFAIHAGPISSQLGARKRLMYSFAITRRKEVRRFLDEIPLYGIKKLTAQKLWAGSKPKHDKDLCRFYRKSTTPVGALETHDIEVDSPEHLFVLANGLIVSNSSKHSGGVAGAAATTGGFSYINSLVQTPKTFPGGAAHAEIDGRVDHVEPAPAGGFHVTVQGQEHYVPQGLGLKVKVGDEIEAGDVLSEGMPNPATVVKHKGIGEGRRYFVKAFRDAFRDSGVKAHRRNVELLARGLINHVRLTDEFGEGAPEDVIPYDMIESQYEPRPEATDLEPRAAVGQYLERPYLHYTIGTKIRPSMLPIFGGHNITSIKTHRDPPPFEPEMIRGLDNLSHDPGWMTRQLGSGLKTSVLEAARRGSTSDEAGTSYVPGLAKAVDFGHVGVLKPPGRPFSVLSSGSQSVIGPITDTDVAERPLP